MPDGPAAIFSPRRYRVNQTIVEQYARVSGDHNPLHLDPAFAERTPYGRTIAHGMMTLCFLSDSLQAWIGDCWAESGSVDVIFLSPVFPGDIVTVQAIEPLETADGRRGWKAECRVGDRIVMAAEVKVASRERK